MPLLPKNTFFKDGVENYVMVHEFLDHRTLDVIYRVVTTFGLTFKPLFFNTKYNPFKTVEDRIKSPTPKLILLNRRGTGIRI